MWNRKLIEGNLNIEILSSLAVQYSCSVTDVLSVTDASAIAIHDAAVEVNQKKMFEKTVHL